VGNIKCYSHCLNNALSLNILRPNSIPVYRYAAAVTVRAAVSEKMLSAEYTHVRVGEPSLGQMSEEVRSGCS